MAAVSSAQAMNSMTPRSSHGYDDSWGYADNHVEDHTAMNNPDDAREPAYGHGRDMSNTRAHGDENFGDQINGTTQDGILLPPFQDSRSGPKSPAGWDSRSHHRGEESQQSNDLVPGQERDSKWIHRDKLAKIENDELQAAGLYVPRSRAPSKQGRERSRSAMRRATDASEQSHTTQPRSRKNSESVERRPADIVTSSWDLRTPEEIAEEESQAYFATSALMGGSKIPVARASPAPISLEHLGGSSSLGRRSESPETIALTNRKTRSRSGSITLRDMEKPTTSSGLSTGKRIATDTSPKKNPPGKRNMSSGARSVVPSTRPKTRNGSGGTTTRPSTRSGESPPSKPMEGDPPWLVNAYKPDPRLPPDQQLLPTVAKRLQQERWEKEGTYGDTYDKEFRPLNDKALLKPPEPEKLEGEQEEERQAPQSDEWPFKAEAANKSPTLRQGSYSTMPKISDKPPASPIPSRRPSAVTQVPTTHIYAEPQPPQRLPVKEEEESKSKGGCGCCVVM